jgi:predicted Ser/Thr protein kinase
MGDMDLINLNEFLENIQVRNQINEDVEVINNSELEMIGKGRQGAVFKLSEEICVKVFGNTEDCEREYQALLLGQQSNLFPKIIQNGTLYVAMEMIKGIDLREYLQSQPLTKELSSKLIEMLITFKTIGFERIDHHKRQIFIKPDGNLKVIDVARTIWRDRVYPYPRKLLTSLGEENKDVFLSHVQELAPLLYKEWEHYIQMEEIARQIYRTLLTQAPDSEQLDTSAEILLSTTDEQNHVLQLEGLVHKVFKEEWIKTMLAKGIDPEVVMQKIDQYMDNNYSNHSGRGYVYDRHYEHRYYQHRYQNRS